MELQLLDVTFTGAQYIAASSLVWTEITCVILCVALIRFIFWGIPHLFSRKKKSKKVDDNDGN